MWSIPGMRYAFLTLDDMHIACLGIAQYLMGNVLLELFFRLEGQVGDPAEAISRLLRFTRIAAQNVRAKDKQGIAKAVWRLRLNMLKQPGKDPKFRGKAAETRRMCYCVDFILSDILQPRNDHERQVAQCVKALTNFYREMEDWNPESSPAQARKFGRQHILLYTELYRAGQVSRIFETYGYHVYKFYPKHHMFIHLVEIGIQSCGNPREVLCYGDEDMLGDLVDIAEASHPAYIHRVVIDRHRL
jgi:hypothetical protein